MNDTNKKYNKYKKYDDKNENKPFHEVDPLKLQRIELINRLNVKDSKKLRKLRRISLMLLEAEGLEKLILFERKSLLLSRLSPEEYKEYAKLLTTYFHEKRDLLQYMFPYIIEHKKMQSKFITTRYYNSVNLVVPFIYDFHRIIQDVDPIKYHKSYIQNSKENTYLNRKINRYSIRTNNNMDIKRFKSNFHLYKNFFYGLHAILYKQRKINKIITEHPKSEISNNSVIKYQRYKYFKYPTYLWNIVFQDPIIEKFTNLFIKHGKKEKAEKLMINFFFQFHDYMRCNPLFMFKTAIENVRPYVCSKSIPFGRRTKIVPHPINEKQQIKLAMKWMKHETLSFKNKTPLHFKLMDTLINAVNKRGYAYNQMLSLHTDAYAQRAYMYSNYYLKSSKAKNKRPF